MNSYITLFGINSKDLTSSGSNNCLAIFLTAEFTIARKWNFLNVFKLEITKRYYIYIIEDKSGVKKKIK